MELFKAKGSIFEGSLNSLRLETPLKEISLNVSSNDLSLVSTQPDQILIVQSNSKAIVTKWRNPNSLIELLKVELFPQLPKEMKVEKCFAFVWRVSPITEAIYFDFECTLEKPERFESHPESGEELVAQTFSDSNYCLTMGTEDEDYLSQRSYVAKGLSRRLNRSINSEVVYYTESGLKINLPKLYPNEVAQVHYVVAWSNFVNNHISSCFAVDQKSTFILEQAKCS